MILAHYLANLRRSRHIQQDDQPGDDDPPESYVIPDDTQPQELLQALDAISIPNLLDKEARHICADMILCDLLLWAMRTHEDGDTVSAAHTFVERYQSIDKWYA